MSLTSAPTALSSSVQPRIRTHGSGTMCVHGFNASIEPDLPDDSPNPTARISFASDTNFNSKCKSRVSKKAKTAAINIRPIKVGESIQVTKFQVPKATAPSFVHKHCSVTKADFLVSRDTPSFPDYSKIPHYICRSTSNVSEDIRFSDDVRKSMPLLQGHRSVMEGHCDAMTNRNGTCSDRTHVKIHSSLGKERKQSQFSCASHCVSARSVFWTRPSTEMPNFQQFVPRRPVFRHVRDTRPHLKHVRSFHLNNNESAKRLNHKFKCLECCKFRTSLQNVGCSGKQDAVCEFYDGSYSEI